jgi:hypothetical protein
MNTIRKNSKGYNYKYADLAETHRYLDEIGERYYQEIETVDGEDYVITHCLDASGKEIRKCRGCRVTKGSLAEKGKGNPAQEAGSALTYARRYSLWLAYGLATADDDGAALNPKSTAPKARDNVLDRQAGMDRIKQLLDTGKLQLSEVQSEVRKYGATKMQDLPPDAFVKCLATLTQGIA